MTNWNDKNGTYMRNQQLGIYLDVPYEALAAFPINTELHTEVNEQQPISEKLHFDRNCPSRKLSSRSYNSAAQN